MKICKDYDFYELKDNSWSGAIDTLNRIEEEGKEDELMNFLEECFVETPTDTEVNDFLWFEDEYIFEVLGIKDEDEDEEDEEEEETEDSEEETDEDEEEERELRELLEQQKAEWEEEQMLKELFTEDEE